MISFPKLLSMIPKQETCHLCLLSFQLNSNVPINYSYVAVSMRMLNFVWIRFFTYIRICILLKIFLTKLVILIPIILAKSSTYYSTIYAGTIGSGLQIKCSFMDALMAPHMRVDVANNRSYLLQN